MSGRPVVVGVTGAPSSHATARWAAREALARHRVLRIVHAADYDTGDVPAWHRHARLVLSRAAATARGAAPGVVLETVLVEQPPVAALEAEALGAELLVLGAVGSGHPADGPADPVLRRVLDRVRVPVAVVHASTAEGTGPVVVGLEYPRTDAELLHDAHACARRRGGVLRIVHALRPGHGSAPAVTAVFAELARHWDERSDAVDVELEVVDDRPLPALLRAAEHAGLLVVGARPHVGGLLRRSTPEELACLAACPVLVRPVGPAPGRDAQGASTADSARRGVAGSSRSSTG